MSIPCGIPQSFAACGPQDAEEEERVTAIHSAAHMGRNHAGCVTTGELVALLSLPCAVPGRAPRRGARAPTMLRLTVNPLQTMSLSATTFRIHRWMGWLIGVQLVIWVTGGVVFSLLPFQPWVKGIDTVKYLGVP